MAKTTTRKRRAPPAPSFEPDFAVPLEHPAPRRKRPLKALADRPGYPFHDRAAALRIVAASQRDAGAKSVLLTYLKPRIWPPPPV